MKTKNKKSKKMKMEDSVVAYLREIDGISVLSREEEEDTARKAAAGDKLAREKLIRANLRFVVKVAKKYRGYGLPFEDLISEGNAGLLEAVNRFDVQKGHRFITYAVWWIRQSIINALYKKVRMITLPVNRAAELVNIKRASRYVKGQYSQESEVKEVAEFLNMDKNLVNDLINISTEMLSLDNPVSGDGSIMLQDFIEDDRYDYEKDLENKFLQEDINYVLNSMDKEEADIIRCRYGIGCEPMTLQEVGERYNLCKERIRQIEERALSRLRVPSRTDLLEVYVA